MEAFMSTTESTLQTVALTTAFEAIQRAMDQMDSARDDNRKLTDLLANQNKVLFEEVMRASVGRIEPAAAPSYSGAPKQEEDPYVYRPGKDSIRVPNYDDEFGDIT
jgi:hypothetical protein